MIDVKSFNLTYIRKSDGRPFKVKRISSADYVILDDTNDELKKVPITFGYLKRDYKFGLAKFRGKEIRLCKRKHA
jgi:hypothetical protein